MDVPWQAVADWDKTFGLYYTDDSYRSQHSYYQAERGCYGGPRRPLPYDQSCQPAYRDNQARIQYKEVNVARVRDRHWQGDDPATPVEHADINPDIVEEPYPCADPDQSTDGDVNTKKKRRRRKKKHKNIQQECEHQHTEAQQHQVEMDDNDEGAKSVVETRKYNDTDGADGESIDDAATCGDTEVAIKKKTKRKKKKRKINWTIGNVLDTLLGRNGYAHHSNNFDVRTEPESFTAEERLEMGYKWQKELAYLELHKFQLTHF